jgi:hypothetical protein
MLALILVASCTLLVGSFALARADTGLPSNTIDCAVFKKTPNGNWYVGPRTTFDVGHLKQSGYGIILLFRMIRIVVFAESTCTTS